MRKRFDDLFAALMLLAAVAVVVAGGWCLRHSIERAKMEPAPARRVVGTACEGVPLDFYEWNI